MNVGVFLKQTPVEPGDIVVLAKSVVVATLGTTYLVSHKQHRRPYGEQGHGEKILDLTVAQTLEVRVVGLYFGTAVPTEIAVGTVPVTLAVYFIVLAVEGNQIVEGKAVVAGNEVDALLGLAVFSLIHIRAPGQPERHC